MNFHCYILYIFSMLKLSVFGTAVKYRYNFTTIIENVQYLLKCKWMFYGFYLNVQLYNWLSRILDV